MKKFYEAVIELGYLGFAALSINPLTADAEDFGRQIFITAVKGLSTSAVQDRYKLLQSL